MLSEVLEHLERPQDALTFLRKVEDAGFAVDEIELYATQGRPVAKAVANKVSVSVVIVARAA